VTTKRPIALLALALACSSSSSVGSRFDGPAAAVSFTGFTGKATGIGSYVAVASSRGDELRILDPSDLEPVLSPGIAFPLSIPTAPRPLLLAAASLGDGQADVLVAVSGVGSPFFSAGSGPSLQVIETWSPTNRVAYDVALEGVLGAGAEILSVAGVQARSGVLARILVGASGASGGQLAAVEFTRATDGSGAVVAQALTAASVNQLGFAPLDIAVEPASVQPDGSTAPGTHLYIATPDPIGAAKVFGVAQLDTSAGAPQTWVPVPLNALAPTVAVAAGFVDDRLVDPSDPCSPDRFGGVPALFVYAALDESACGSDKPIDCGIVTIDPARVGAATQLAADPAKPVPPPATAPAGGNPTPVPAQDYRAPMPVPGNPTHIAIGKAPASGAQRVFTDSSIPSAACPTSSSALSPLLKIAPGTGQRYTSAVAMVTSIDGRVYWLDLSRFGPMSDVSVMKGSTRVAVTGASSVAVASTDFRFGLWNDVPSFGASSFTPSVTVDSTALAGAIDVWPGFTDTGRWSVIYQGTLPSLSARPGVLAASAGNVYAAVQSDIGGTALPTSSARWTVGAKLSDPGLGVHAGDIVVLSDLGCETTVVAVVPPDATGATVGVAAPGGAVQIAPATCLPALGAGQFQATTITLRAAGLVLANDRLGYLGRPGIGTTTDPEDQVFAVAWSDETALAQDTTDPIAPERLAIARKARRLYYPSDGPCPILGATAGSQGTLQVGCYTGFPRLSEPLAPGPIIRFRIGVVPPTAPDPANPTPPLVRGAGVVFTTQPGLSATFRSPNTGGALPAGVFSYDRTSLSGHQDDPIRFFVPYLDDLVLFFSPSESSGSQVTIR
jgi:hypothetical protein